MKNPATDTVRFRSPWTQVAGDILANGLLLAAPLLLLVTFADPAVSAAVMAAVLFVSFWAVRARSGPFWSIRIGPGGVQLGGRFFSRHIPGADIRFVRGGSLIEKAAGVSGSQQIVIETDRKKFKMRLRARDIEACIRAILEQAPQAAGADYSRVDIKFSPLSTGVTIDTDKIVEYQPRAAGAGADARVRSGRYLRDCGLWVLAGGGLFFAGIALKLLGQDGDLTAGRIMLYLVAALVACAMGGALIAAGSARSGPAAMPGGKKEAGATGAPHE